MSHQSQWSEMTKDLYAKLGGVKSAHLLESLNQLPISFFSESSGIVPSLSQNIDQGVSILFPEAFDEVFLENAKAVLLTSTDQDLKKVGAKTSLYLAPSSQLTSFKKSLAKNATQREIDFGIDPFSLGLWKSQLLRSQVEPSFSTGLHKKSKIFRLSSQAYHMAGASETQQLALLLSSLTQLLKDYEGQWSLDQLLQSLSFEVSLGADPLVGSTKIQALRLLLARMLEAGDWGSVDFPIYATPCPRYLATREPWNNLLRLTSMNMGSILGGAQGFVHFPYDLFAEAKESRLSRNIDLILNEESFLSRVNQPTRGSYGLDTLLHSLCSQAWSFFQEIEKKEGLRQALRSGWLQQEILREHDLEVSRFLKREIKMTGVNHFALAEPVSEEFPLPQQEDVSDLESWWEKFSMEEVTEKLCDVEKVLPLQLSSFFEAWQFQVDQIRRTHPDKVQVPMFIEEGLEQSPKLILAKEILTLAGFKTVESGTEEKLQNCFYLLVASDPEGDFAKNQLSKIQEKPNQFCLWAGEKEFSFFKASIGKKSDLMSLFELLIKLAKGGL